MARRTKKVKKEIVMDDIIFVPASQKTKDNGYYGYFINKKTGKVVGEYTTSLENLEKTILGGVNGRAY